MLNWTLVGEERRIECKKNSSKVPVVDQVKFCMFKLLETGHIPKQPIIAKAKFFSRNAGGKNKITYGASILRA